MNNSKYRKMRVIILFDLPFIEKEDVLNYNKFIKNIKKVGFYMLQYSVYTKSIVNNSEYQRIQKNIAIYSSQREHNNYAYYRKTIQ